MNHYMKPALVVRVKAETSCTAAHVMIVRTCQDSGTPPCRTRDTAAWRSQLLILGPQTVLSPYLFSSFFGPCRRFIGTDSAFFAHVKAQGCGEHSVRWK